MHKKHPLRSLFHLTLSALAAISSARADVVLNGLFADHMVLQRDAKVPVWGTATPGEEVTVTFGKASAKATAGTDGKWIVKLDPMPANASPEELVVAGKNTLKIEDVLIGDVWLCSGQSNMELRAGGLKNNPLYSNDILSANFPDIRLSFFTKKASETPLDSIALNWAPCTPDSVAKFSAAGFYFARDLQKELKVPIGLLWSTWGGTSAKAWTSLEALNTVPSFKQLASHEIDLYHQLPFITTNFPVQLKAWEEKNGRSDTNNLGEQQGWADPATSTSDWISGSFDLSKEKLGTPDGGIVWVRKGIVIPETASGKGFHMTLGKANEKYFTIYFNGKKLVEAGHTPPNFYLDNAGTGIPSDLVKAGTNLIAMRIVSDTGASGFLGSKPSKWDMSFPGATTIADDCQFKVEKKFDKLPPDALAERPNLKVIAAQGVSSYLFNGMIYPMIPFAIKGVVWYQGESDTGRAFAYRTMLPTMLNDWRARWGQGNFPILIQQLPNYHGDMVPHVAWAQLREAEAMTATNLPNCGLSCAIDIGEGGNVHPLNKRDVGHRLSLVALAKFYGKNIPYSGPLFDSSTVEGATIRVKFQHAEGLKSLDGKPLTQFAIAASDGNFIPAEAKIEGDTVVVSSPQVPKPAFVRYAWIDDPERCNFVNAIGLPAFPFRTDTLPGPTDNIP